MTTATFFNTFFEEKGLTEEIYEVEAKNDGIFGATHLIPTTAVIERIKTTRGEEAKKIEAILRELDFRNGDVHHFLRHLAQAMAEQF
jgi:hypothetical protein|tara:strand:+ start:427 stop:687 length:261 start_codon:yes stop_codon:yes gene_type:complete